MFYIILFFFFNDTATTEIYTLSLHDALPILPTPPPTSSAVPPAGGRVKRLPSGPSTWTVSPSCSSDSHAVPRSEEHTSELQSRQYLVCRLLLEKKKKNQP